jgi:hypothetical protein
MITILYNTIWHLNKTNKNGEFDLQRVWSRNGHKLFYFKLFMRPNKIGQGNGHKLKKISSLNHMKKIYPWQTFNLLNNLLSCMLFDPQNIILIF